MSIVVKFTWPTLLVHRQSSRRRRSTYQSGLEVMFDDDNDQEQPSCVYLYGCFKSPCDLIPAYLTYQRSRNGSLDRVLYTYASHVCQDRLRAAAVVISEEN